MYLFFDTETNGLPKNWKASVKDLSNWPRLVQIAWILYDKSGNEIERNDHIIKPEGFSIPKKTASVHGISTKRAISEGQDLLFVLDEFKTQVQKTTYLVAHNMSFDKKIVGAEFLRKEMSNPIPRKKKICTMEGTINYVAIPGYKGNKWPKLSELHKKLFGFDFEEAHDAAADIHATAKCFWEAKKLGIL